MTKYEVKSQMNVTIIKHEYFKNGEKDDSLRNLNRWQEITEFHEKHLRKYPISSVMRTIEEI